VSRSAVFAATFLAAAVELTEMVIIVVASAPAAGGGRPGLAPRRAWPSPRISRRMKLNEGS
jgi:hypothetical protein